MARATRPIKNSRRKKGGRGRYVFIFILCLVTFFGFYYQDSVKNNIYYFLKLAGDSKSAQNIILEDEKLYLKNLPDTNKDLPKSIKNKLDDISEDSYDKDDKDYLNNIINAR